MHKSAIFGLFLMASLLMGTSVNMNMFSNANAQGMAQNDNSYAQSTYGQNPYDTSSSYDTQPYYGEEQTYNTQYSYDQPKYDNKYSDYKTKDKKY